MCYEFEEFYRQQRAEEARRKAQEDEHRSKEQRPRSPEQRPADKPKEQPEPVPV
jgi:hypothetical protein